MATLTQTIFGLDYPYDNPWQGSDKKLLFVCTAGLLRSPTCAAVALKEGYNTRSCGSAEEYALILINENLVKWADKIIFMQESNKWEAERHFSERKHIRNLIDDKAIVWHIYDDYSYGSHDLEEKARGLLKEILWD